MRKNWLVGLCLVASVACGDDRTQETESTDGAAAIEPPDGGSTTSPRALVTLADGQVQGDVMGGAVRFVGIPYAKPPTGELRYRAPEKNAPWEGLLQASELPSACPQSESRQTPESLEEDCLYLNVWRPDRQVANAPVMVWIHGGAHRSGGTADIIPGGMRLWYDGKRFAERHGIVVVTMNYRLGPFGFFAHPALAEEGSPLGNQGLLDQHLALTWVRDNISAFGGDPDNVTIFGESAGAADVCLHVASPKSRGLFHRAISQSGGCTGRPPGDPADRDEQLAEYAAELGCTDDGVLACLRDKPVAELLRAANQTDLTTIGSAAGSLRFGPSLDGPDGFSPISADQAFETGEIAQVPYLLGANTDEGTLFFLGQTMFPETDAEYLEELTMRWGDFAERVFDVYPPTDFDGDHGRALQRAFGDSFLACGTEDTARKAAAAGLTVYAYNFNVPWSVARDLLGATHASEIAHVFGEPHDDTAASQEVADAMHAYWARFAATGDPNGQGAPVEWPRFMPTDDDGDRRIQFDPAFEILTDHRKNECELWRDYGAAQE